LSSESTSGVDSTNPNLLFWWSALTQVEPKAEYINGYTCGTGIDPTPEHIAALFESDCHGAFDPPTGIDPMAQRKEEKAAKPTANSNSFQIIAVE
jgi:hypothetical protein